MTSSGATIPARAPGFDRHVAHRHPAFHAQAPDRVPAVLDDVAHPAAGADLTDDGQDQVLGAHTGRKLADHGDGHGSGPRLGEGLGGQDVLDLAGSDPEGEGAEGAVGGGVAVAADDRHARLRQAELGADDVHDPLMGVAHGKQPNPELGAVGREHFDLAGRDGILDGPVQGGGRHIVVHGGDGQVRPAHPAAGQPQSVEGLRRGHLVDQVQIDVQQVGFVGGLADHVPVPHLLGQGKRWAHTLSHSEIESRVMGAN